MGRYIWAQKGMSHVYATAFSLASCLSEEPSGVAELKNAGRRALRGRHVPSRPRTGY